MSKDELILLYANRVVALSTAKQDAINMGDIDRVVVTDLQLQEAEAELAKLKAE